MKGDRQMAQSLNTKQELADALKLLLKDHSLIELTIADISQQAGMNRKSFYYHFKDKFDLVNWIFYTEYFDLYMNASDDHPDMILYMCRYLEQNLAFYRSALKVTGQNSFDEYLSEVLHPIIRDRMRSQVWSDKYMEFYVGIYVDMYHNAIVKWIKHGCQIPPDTFVRLLYHTSELSAKPAKVN